MSKTKGERQRDILIMTSKKNMPIPDFSPFVFRTVCLPLGVVSHVRHTKAIEATRKSGLELSYVERREASL